jgi:hypothetical protein
MSPKYTRESSVAIYVSNLPMIWPLIREWVPFLRTVNSTNYVKNTRQTNTQNRRRLQKGSSKRSTDSEDLDTSALSRSGSLKAAVAALAGSRWHSRTPSVDSLDEKYDLEMGMKSSAAVAVRDAGPGLGISNSIRKSDGSQEGSTGSQERILGTLGVQRTVMETQQPGGISVERTIVVHEEVISNVGTAATRHDAGDINVTDDDGQTRLYDWERRDAPSRASFDTEVRA